MCLHKYLIILLYKLKNSKVLVFVDSKLNRWKVFCLPGICHKDLTKKIFSVVDPVFENQHLINFIIYCWRSCNVIIDRIWKVLNFDIFASALDEDVSAIKIFSFGVKNNKNMSSRLDKTSENKCFFLFSIEWWKVYTYELLSILLALSNYVSPLSCADFV
jgi:hypothetical protein